MGNGKKHTFRKMYFRVENGRIIQDNVWSINIYRRRDDLIKAWPDYTRLKPYLWEENQPPIKREVIGFYLVHESLFEEILAKYAKNVIDASADGENLK